MKSKKMSLARWGNNEKYYYKMGKVILQNRAGITPYYKMGELLQNRPLEM